MHLKKHITLFLFGLISIQISAQETWSLDSCIDYAITHNLELNDYKFRSDAGKETYRQSIRNVLPTLDGSSGYIIQYGRSTDPNTNTKISSDFFSNDYSLNSSIDIFRGFQKINTIKASKFLYSAAKEEVTQQKFLLAFRVMSAFYDIKFYEELVALSKEQEKVSQSNYNLVKRQIELGLKAGADLYEAESLLLTDKLSVTQNSNFLAAAKLTLIQEMNLPDVKDISITEDLVTKEEEEHLLNIDSDSIFSIAREFVPSIKSQELRTRAAKKDVAIARGGLYPSLSVFAGYGTGYFETTKDNNGLIVPFRTQIKDNASRYVGASLNIPISNRWSGRSRIKQQKIALMQANNTLDVQEQQLYQLIQSLTQDHNAFQVEYEQSTQKMKAQDLAFAIAQKKYEKGLINALELFQAKNLYANAQTENLQVRFKLKVNESNLKFYQGLPIFNITR